MTEPFAYVAHKDGKWGGVCSPFAGKDGVKDFLADFAADGFTIQPVATREEYDALNASLGPDAVVGALPPRAPSSQPAESAGAKTGGGK